MKILHWAWILIAIILPISIVCRVNVNARYSALRDEVRINNAIDTATNDAIDQIITANGAGFDYDSEFGDVINITPALAQEAINTFFSTMAINFNLPFQSGDNVSTYESSPNSYIQNYFSTYIPAVVVIAYDGFYVYGQRQNSEGYYVYQLSTKIPYTYTSPHGYTIGYTLGEDIYLYIDGVCYSGRLQGNTLSEIVEAYSGDFGYMTGVTTKDVASLTNNMSEILYSLITTNNRKTIGNELLPTSDDTNFLQDYKKDNKDNYTVGKFHENRRKVIIQIIADTLKEQMNIQNHYADLVGCTYDFGLPEISEDDWINSIDDISVMAFVQGIPVGATDGIFYNNYALGGSRIVERDYYYGAPYTNESGVTTNLYHKKNCSLIRDKLDEYGYYKDEYNLEGYQTFIIEDDAIEAGYHACQLCN